MRCAIFFLDAARFRLQMAPSRRRSLDRQRKTITRNPLTGVVLFEYHNSLKVMLLIVAITEATECESADLSQECMWDPSPKPFIGSEIERRRKTNKAAKS